MSRWVPDVITVLKRRRGGQKRDRGDDREQGQWDAAWEECNPLSLALKTEEGAVSRGMWEALEAGKARKWNPYSFQKGTASWRYLYLSPERPVSAPSPQNCKKINLCCFQALDLRQFVTAARGNQYIPLAGLWGWCLHTERTLSYLGYHHSWAVAALHTHGRLGSLPSGTFAASFLPVSRSPRASAEPQPLRNPWHSSAHKSSFSHELPWPLQSIPGNFGRNYTAGSVAFCCCVCVYFGSKTKLKPWAQTGLDYVLSSCCCF